MHMCTCTCTSSGTGSRRGFPSTRHNQSDTFTAVLHHRRSTTLAPSVAIAQWGISTNQGQPSGTLANASRRDAIAEIVVMLTMEARRSFPAASRSVDPDTIWMI